MKRSADDILPGAKRNPAPVQSDNTRVTPRRPQSGANNPNAATIRPVSRASQALNAARTVSTTVDAVASAAEAGVSLRRGDVGAAIVGAGLAGAAAMGVRNARVARSANAIQDAGASANRIRSSMGSVDNNVARSARRRVAAESFTSTEGNPGGLLLDSRGGMSTGNVTKGREFRFSDEVADPRNPVRSPSATTAKFSGERTVGARLSPEQARREAGFSQKVLERTFDVKKETPGRSAKVSEAFDRVERANKRLEGNINSMRKRPK
jgi:hypothetical protein